MLHEWFECKVKYEKQQENGSLKKVQEPYLVDAINFTEAERRITEEIAPFMTGEFQVSDIKRARFADLFEAIEESADKWYKAKLIYITIDESKGVEKKTSQNFLIQASSFHDALKRLDKGMESFQGDYTIASIQETAIMDVFRYKLEMPSQA
jgi:hypothetical protein